MALAEIIVRLDMEIRAVERTRREAEDNGNRPLAQTLARRLDQMRADRTMKTDVLESEVGDPAAWAQIRAWRRELDASYARSH